MSFLKKFGKASKANISNATKARDVSLMDLNDWHNWSKKDQDRKEKCFKKVNHFTCAVIFSSIHYGPI